ncbi:hypothetical protein WAI453_006522 [Rhynchosporium graminicola]
MKLTLLSALFISSALSAAINDAGPEARHDTAPKINDAGLETRENGQPFCHCIVGQVTNPSNPSYRPNYISDDVPNGSGFIKRYVNLRDSSGKVLEEGGGTVLEITMVTLDWLGERSRTPQFVRTCSTRRFRSAGGVSSGGKSQCYNTKSLQLYTNHACFSFLSALGIPPAQTAVPAGDDLGNNLDTRQEASLELRLGVGLIGCLGGLYLLPDTSLDSGDAAKNVRWLGESANLAEIVSRQTRNKV